MTVNPVAKMSQFECERVLEMHYHIYFTYIVSGFLICTNQILNDKVLLNLRVFLISYNFKTCQMYEMSDKC